MPSASEDVVGKPIGVAVKFVSAGLSGCLAESVTIPLDTAKVRLQVQQIMSYLSHSRVQG